MTDNEGIDWNRKELLQDLATVVRQAMSEQAVETPSRPGSIRMADKQEPARRLGRQTSEFFVTLAFGLGLLAFTGWMMWLWVTYPEADWAMLLNAVVVPAATWIGKTYVDGRKAEKVERIRSGEKI